LTPVLARTAALAAHAWPDNLRQLSNALRASSALPCDHEHCIDRSHRLDDLGEELAAPRRRRRKTANPTCTCGPQVASSRCRAAAAATWPKRRADCASAATRRTGG
jgi:transcriptional regulator with PAS, ATPase and Fis domain